MQSEDIARLGMLASVRPEIDDEIDLSLDGVQLHAPSL